MTPAELMDTFRTQASSFNDEELAEVAEHFSRVYAGRFVHSPVDGVFALIKGLPHVLERLEPEARERALHMLDGALPRETSHDQS